MKKSTSELELIFLHLSQQDLTIPNLLVLNLSWLKSDLNALVGGCCFVFKIRNPMD
jgi:hypothetical protein